MGNIQLNDYLAEDEELLLSFSAESVVQGEEDTQENTGFVETMQNLEEVAESSAYTFGASDRRIVYLSSTGSFKDIDYQHISSIESEEDVDMSDHASGAALGVCGGFLFLGGAVGFADDPGVGLLLLLAGVGLVALGVKALQNAESEEKQKITFITGDESHQQIEVTLPSSADANISAELSKILREQRR